MFVKSQDGAVVLNNDKVTEYSTDSKYDGRYKVAALVGENRVVIGRYILRKKNAEWRFQCLWTATP